MLFIMGNNENISKDIVFISHATPEDNEIAIWLASRLENAGYNVWVDKNELTGGEEFWDNIQDILTNKTVKFISIISNSSINKNGVKDEISYALELERKNNLSEFILPIKIEENVTVPINLGRKNYIDDFKTDWGTGLERVLNFLDKNNVPRNNISNYKDLELVLRKDVVKLEKGNETIMSNQFKITLPEFIFLYEKDTNANELPRTHEYYDYPVREFAGNLLSFFELQKINSIIESQQLVLVAKYKTDNFINEQYKEYSYNSKKDDIDRVFKTLISKTFDMLFKNKGLKNIQWKHTCDWWFPSNLIPDNKIYFTNYYDKKTYRVITGKSIQYIWHFCFRYRIRSNDNFYIEISPRTIYTDDKDIVIPSDSRLNRIRISRTKTWYNEKWRDLLVGFMYWLNNGNDIVINCGDDNSLICSWKPEFFKSEIKIPEDKLRDDDGDIQDGQ